MLTWNSLIALPTAFGGFPGLLDLDVSHNNMGAKGLMQDFRDYDPEDRWPNPAAFLGLQVIVVQHAGLQALPKAIRAMQRCLFMDCQHNAIRSVPEELGGMLALEQLQLSNNDVSAPALAAAVIAGTASHVRVRRSLRFHTPLGFCDR